MTKKSDAPAIRFKGFSDAWEQRKVSDLAEKTYGGGTPTTSNEAYWNGDIPWIQSSDVVDGKLLGVEPRKWITQDGLNNSAAQLIPGNSIAIITRVGVGKLAFMPYSYATSQDFLSLSKLNAEPLFTVYACYKKLQSELNAVQGTSIKGITKDELLAKNIMVPRYAEQQQIGAFFKQLDNLITLHQRKFEKLTNVKKSMLEKMFPQNGSSYPEIRFKGFTDPWEQRKAKEICSIGTGKSNTQDQVDDGKYPFYIRSDVPVRSNKYLYDCEAVITIGDGNIGKVFHYVNGKFDLHQRCYKMTDFKDIWGKYFFYYFSTKFYDRAMKMTAKATVDSVRLEMISEMDIKKPPQISEQKQIAEFFANLDNLITLHQRELEKLQNIKKSMLEKMFV